jgi:putative transcriptional regulator
MNGTDGNPGVTHPVGDDLLMGYAAGLLPPAQDLMVATAVSLDDDARARLSGFEAMGGGLLLEIEAAPIEDGSFDAVMARINATPPDGSVADRVKTRRAPSVLPQPLREAVGGDLADVRWSPVGMGVRQSILGGDEGGTARLMSIPPGVAIPDHGHGGMEYTLVLYGSVLDGGERYDRGDLGVADAEVEHTPVAGPGETCICLLVTDAPLRFRGLIPRLAQRFIDI